MKRSSSTELDHIARIRAAGPGSIPCQAGNCLNLIPQDGLVCTDHSRCIPAEVAERLVQACMDMLQQVPGARARAYAAREEALKWARKGIDLSVGTTPNVIPIEAGRK